MPAKSAKQYGLMQGVAHGSITGSGIPHSVAREFVDKTPAKKRSTFAKALRSKKKKKGAN
jgi:hypothetical protein